MRGILSGCKFHNNVHAASWIEEWIFGNTKPLNSYIHSHGPHQPEQHSWEIISFELEKAVLNLSINGMQCNIHVAGDLLIKTTVAVTKTNIYMCTCPPPHTHCKLANIIIVHTHNCPYLWGTMPPLHKFSDSETSARVR